MGDNDRDPSNMLNDPHERSENDILNDPEVRQRIDSDSYASAKLEQIRNEMLEESKKDSRVILALSFASSVTLMAYWMFKGFFFSPYWELSYLLIAIGCSLVLLALTARTLRRSLSNLLFAINAFR